VNDSTRRQILTPALHDDANTAIPDTLDLRAAIHARIQTRPAPAARPARRGPTWQQALVPALSLALIVLAGLAIYAFGQQADALTQRRQALAQAATAVANGINAAATVTAGQDQGSRAEALRLVANASLLQQAGGDSTLVALLTLRSLQNSYTREGDTLLSQVAGLDFPRQIIGHLSTGLLDVAISPDGHTLAASGADHVVRLWDAQSGTLLHTLTGHSDEVSGGIAFAPDGKTLITGSVDGTARLWDVASGTPLHTLTQQAWVSVVAFAPDGKLCLSAGQDGIVHIWEVATGREVQHFNSSTWVRTALFTRDGASVISVDFSGTPQQWDLKSGTARSVHAGKGSVESLAVAPKGNTAATGNKDGSVQLWTGETTPAQSFKVPFTIHRVSLSADGQVVLVCGEGQAQLWDGKTGQLLRALNDAGKTLTTGVFTPDGASVLMGDGRGTITRWDVQPRPLLPQTPAQEYGTAALAFAPDGKTFFTAGEMQLSRWNSTTGELVRNFGESDSGSGMGVAITPDGKYVITGGHDNTATMRVVATGQIMHIFHGPAITEPTTQWANNDLALSPDGRYLLTGGWDGIARLWDTQVQNMQVNSPLREFRGHKGAIWATAFAPDGKTVLTGGYDGTARLWDAATGQEIRQFKVPGSAVSAVAFTPDGQAILTGSDTPNPGGSPSADAGVAQVWNPATGAEIRQLSAHNSGIGHIAVAPDGRTALITANNKTAGLWNLADGTEVRHFTSSGFGFRGVAFSPDGHFLLIGEMINDRDDMAHMWTTDYQGLVTLLCGRLLRDFSDAERTEYAIPPGATCR
jgi:WD40 repeat protein